MFPCHVPLVARGSMHKAKCGVPKLEVLRLQRHAFIHSINLGITCTDLGGYTAVVSDLHANLTSSSNLGQLACRRISRIPNCGCALILVVCLSSKSCNSFLCHHIPELRLVHRLRPVRHDSFRLRTRAKIASSTEVGPHVSETSPYTVKRSRHVARHG